MSAADGELHASAMEEIEEEAAVFVDLVEEIERGLRGSGSTGAWTDDATSSDREMIVIEEIDVVIDEDPGSTDAGSAWGSGNGGGEDGEAGEEIIIFVPVTKEAQAFDSRQNPNLDKATTATMSTVSATMAPVEQRLDSRRWGLENTGSEARLRSGVDKPADPLPFLPTITCFALLLLVIGWSQMRRPRRSIPPPPVASDNREWLDDVDLFESAYYQDREPLMRGRWTH